MDNKAIGLQFDNGGELTVVEGGSYTIQPLELKNLDINSFMSVLRRALPKSFAAENSNGIVRIKGPRDFACSFEVKTARNTLMGISKNNGCLFQYQVGRINAINLLRRIFKSVWVEPSANMVYSVLKPNMPNLKSVYTETSRRSYDIFTEPRSTFYIIRLVENDDPEGDPRFSKELNYKIKLQGGNLLFIGEYSYDEEYYGDKTTTIKDMQEELDNIKERIEKAERIRSIVESCNMQFSFSLSSDDLSN
jgi:hypothetical protein